MYSPHGFILWAIILCDLYYYFREKKKYFNFEIHRGGNRTILFAVSQSLLKYTQVASIFFNHFSYYVILDK